MKIRTNIDLERSRRLQLKVSMLHVLVASKGLQQSRRVRTSGEIGCESSPHPASQLAASQAISTNNKSSSKKRLFARDLVNHNRTAVLRKEREKHSGMLRKHSKTALKVWSGLHSDHSKKEDISRSDSGSRVGLCGEFLHGAAEVINVLQLVQPQVLWYIVLPMQR